MEFLLTYDGNLPSRGSQHKPSGTKLQAIWKVRTALEPQVSEQFARSPVLTGRGGSENRAMANLAKRPILRDGVPFLAIVRRDAKLECRVEVELLVNHDTPSVLTHIGDLDNRLKSMVDALTVPPPGQAIMPYVPTLAANEAFPCVLEDDALVTSFSASAQRMLAPPNNDPHYASARIRVMVRASERTFENTSFPLAR